MLQRRRAGCSETEGLYPTCLSQCEQLIELRAMPMFKDIFFHTTCPYMKATSLTEEQCWLGFVRDFKGNFDFAQNSPYALLRLSPTSCVTCVAEDLGRDIRLLPGVEKDDILVAHWGAVSCSARGTHRVLVSQGCLCPLFLVHQEVMSK